MGHQSISSRVNFFRCGRSRYYHQEILDRQRSDSHVHARTRRRVRFAGRARQCARIRPRHQLPQHAHDAGVSEGDGGRHPARPMMLRAPRCSSPANTTASSPERRSISTAAFTQTEQHRGRWKTGRGQPRGTQRLHRRFILTGKVTGGRHTSSLQACTLSAAVIRFRLTRVPFGAEPFNVMVPS
jgi:hypothetical protein